MFGYVKVFQPELKMREWEQYRGMYCSLCRQLGKRYGVLARFLLNYDFTVLALFHMALARDPIAFTKGRCPFNPFKKCARCHGEEQLAEAADAAVMLSYYKLKDDMKDGGWFRRFKRRPLLWIVTPMKRKAARVRPLLAEQMAAYATAQQAVEREDTPSPDAAAHPTATLMAFLTAGDTPPGEERDARTRFGYCLGRWVYLMDAADDWEDDRKRKGFNPFRPDESGRAPRAYMRAALNNCLAECLTSWHLLTRYQFDPIMQNILQYGMPAAIGQVTAPDISGEKGTIYERSV